MTKTNLTTRLFFATVLIALVSSSFAAATWEDSYNKALGAAKEGNWAEARSFFQDAMLDRAQDQSKPTTLPGPITEPKLWRNGAPYSPNFGAAYAAYRMGGLKEDEGERKALWAVSAQELENLITNGQRSAEAVRLLSKLYSSLGQDEANQALRSSKEPTNWKVDSTFLALEDRAQTNTGGPTIITPDGTNLPGGIAGGSDATIIKVRAGQEDLVLSGASSEPVPTVANKYALVVGNTESGMADYAISHASSDAQMMGDALTKYAGYQEDNVVVLTNASAAAILQAARDLVERSGEDATILFYFSGVGVSLDGKDYYAGTKTQFSTDTSSMLAKSDLQKALLRKGAKVFMFNQVHRSILDGNYFGKEAPQVGMIAEVQGTRPGAKVHSFSSGETQVGVYTNSLINVLKNFRSNSIPISEYCWQVFYDVRGGTPGNDGGGSVQTPTLPVITNMDKEARF